MERPIRTIVLNDTRSQIHIGCQLVMWNLLSMCRQVGLNVVGTVLNSGYADEEVVRWRRNDYDLLLVNGEGTLHHDAPKALTLCRAAEIAARQRKRVVLLNTVWQANRELNRYLPCFDLIFCRESRSQAAIEAAGHHATVVPDLALATEVAPTARPHKKRATAVIDSVARDTTVEWAWRALRQQYGFFTMHDQVYRELREQPWLRWGIWARSGTAIEQLGADWASQLARFQRVISGRFHGCCLAFLLRLPVLGIPSNTHKIEGLFDDVGIGEAGLLRPKSALRVAERFEFVESRADDVSRYTSNAKRLITTMFRDIQGLAYSAAQTRYAA